MGSIRPRQNVRYIGGILLIMLVITEAIERESVRVGSQ